MTTESQQTALFVSEPGFLDPAKSGGVQRCTLEYVALLKAAGFCVEHHAITATRSVISRLKARAGVDVYDLYGPELAQGIAASANRTRATLIALNQAYLLPVASELRVRCPSARIVVLSHGNESGDFLHETVRTERSASRSALDAARLGAMVRSEARGFMDVDAVLCLSETERQINLWLGAREAVTVPRTWTPQFLDWSPVRGRVGFVGALDHLPNTEGIGRVLDALADANTSDVEVRIVGGGGGGPELTRRFRGATYLGRLSDDELLAEASTWTLFLNPVWWYARGATTKLAQAISWGLPIVTSDPGTRGYEWSDGDLVTAETPEAMAAVIERVTRDPGVARSLRESVRRVTNSGPTINDVASKVRPCLVGADEPAAERVRWPQVIG